MFFCARARMCTPCCIFILEDKDKDLHLELGAGSGEDCDGPYFLGWEELIHSLGPAPKNALSPAQTNFTLVLKSSIVPEKQC